MPNDQTASGAQVPCISLLEARAKFIDEYEKKLRGQAPMPDEPIAKIVAEVTLACARESAGAGFDAGFTFASNK